MLVKLERTMSKRRRSKMVATGSDTRVVKPRIGHVEALRMHRVERDERTYHRASAKAALRRGDF